MASPCYYHPGTIAGATCVQCGLPICTDCTDRVADKTVCQKCVKAVKTRLEAQMAAAPVGAAYSGSSAPSGYSPSGYNSPTLGYAGQSSNGVTRAVSSEPLDAGKLMLGIIVALAIGIIAAVIVEKITVATNWEIAYLFVAIGYGIGFGLHRVTGRGGMGMAFLAVGIMVLSLLAAQVAFTADALAQHIASHPEDRGATIADAFPMVLSGMGGFYWVCAAIGLYSCFKGMMRRA